jgi:FlgD Ig-like domain
MPEKFLKIYVFSFLLVTCLAAQNTFYAEYFFDFDPGLGQGTAIAATQGDSIFVFSVDKNNLQPGFHILYIRSKDGQGRWSQHVLRPFYINPGQVQDTTKANIIYAEYYFDKDPGFGNGVGMSLNPGITAEGAFFVDKSQLKAGFHNFYIRAKDENNSWTLHIARPFLISKPVEKKTDNISAIEYYFYREGVHSDTFQVAGFAPGTDVSIDFQPEFTNLLNDSTYDFHVYAVDSSGRRSLNFVFGDQVINDIEEGALTALLPKTVELKANYPNPFNPATQIKFGLPEAGKVKLVVYDIIGRQVAVLLDKQMSAGYHNVQWQGQNDQGHALASGFYIYQLTAEKKILSRKMILLK